MRTLQHPTLHQQITVPDNVVEDYLSRGWVAPGAPAPATPPTTEEQPWQTPHGSDTTTSGNRPASQPAAPNSTSKRSNASSKKKTPRRKSGRPAEA